MGGSWGRSIGWAVSDACIDTHQRDVLVPILVENGDILEQLGWFLELSIGCLVTSNNPPLLHIELNSPFSQLLIESTPVLNHAMDSVI